MSRKNCNNISEVYLFKKKKIFTIIELGSKPEQTRAVRKRTLSITLDHH